MFLVRNIDKKMYEYNMAIVFLGVYKGLLDEEVSLRDHWNLIITFLANLSTPLCFIAHNGYKNTQLSSNIIMVYYLGALMSSACYLMKSSG